MLKEVKKSNFNKKIGKKYLIFVFKSYTQQLKPFGFKGFRR